MAFLLLIPLAALTSCASQALRATESRAQWLELEAPEGRKIRAAVAWPQGDGPFPLVVILHGTMGFRTHDLWLAEDFARAGLAAVAGCWFAGGRAPRVPVAELIDCAQGPAFKGASIAATKDVMALIDAVRKLARVRPDRVGLFGHSRGAAVALLVASTGGDVQAVVSSSAPIIFRGARTQMDTPPITLVRNLQAPLLMLHGTGDRVVDVQEARQYQQALRELGKPIEAHYYEGAGHLLPFLPETKEDVRQRAIGFFKAHLSR